MTGTRSRELHRRMAEMGTATVAEADPRVSRLHTAFATQAKVHGAAALLVDAAVRDVDALADIGLPVWARWIRVRGSGKSVVGDIDVSVAIDGTVIRPGDLVVMDGDGVVVVEDHLVPKVHDAAVAREERERVRRAELLAGALVYDLDDLQYLMKGVGHEQQA